MNSNEQISSIMDTTNNVKASTSDSLCKVCGTHGAQIHYGALCCVSCKMFFRRNAQYDLSTHQCVFNEKCDITINSRRACRYCRLQKCLSIGMQRELLRASHHRQEKSNDKTPTTTTTTITPKLPSNDLLCNDRSLLTDEQWCRLSNVINFYNTKSQISHIRQLLSTQSKHPIKMRLKMAKNNFLEIIHSMYQALRPFVETIPEFHSMQLQDQCELIKRNLSYVGGFNGIIIFRDAEVTLSTAFKNGFPSVYGSTIVDDSIVIAHRTDKDLTLIKLLIPIIFFSTTLHNIIPNTVNNNGRLIDENTNSIFFNTKHLLYIQNIYVEMMFKYMIYRFGYAEASLRFAALIKCFLDQSMCIYSATGIQTHNELIKTVVEEIHTSLASQSEPME